MKIYVYYIKKPNSPYNSHSDKFDVKNINGSMIKGDFCSIPTPFVFRFAELKDYYRYITPKRLSKKDKKRMKEYVERVYESI